jgi:hypothetical protein
MRSRLGSRTVVTEWTPSMANTSSVSSDAVIDSMHASVAATTRIASPYPHWFLNHCLPEQAVREIQGLPFAAPALSGISGKRELHNATRTYFDAPNRAAHGVCQAVCQGFQDPRLTKQIETAFGTKLAGTYLRVEFAQDINGFWLEPHTDLGVKVFTMLLYLSTDPQHAALGTDFYDADKKHLGRSPFTPNGAMVFVPSNNTYHGFEARQIDGVRKSVIINYVTNDWKAREQLAFPDTPIAA